MSSRTTVLFLCFLVHATGNTADIALAERLRETVATDLTETMSQDFGPVLVESGMAKSDSDRIIERLAAKSADCMIDALILQAKKDSVDVDEILAAAEHAFHNRTGEDFVETLDDEELNQRIDYCVSSALQEAGLKLD